MYLGPHLDTFKTGRLLVPHVKIKLKLFCNTPDFILFDSKWSITLIDADLKVKLYLCRVSLNVFVCNMLHAKLQAICQPARYPVVSSEICTFAFDGNTAKFEKDDVFVG